jgi:hypothetical protein
MNDPNQQQNPGFAQKAGDFAVDAAVDTTADSLLNNVLGTVEQHVPIPGGETVDKMITTETDQVVNNEINAEVNKGVGGILGDVEGLFGKKE